MGKKVEIEITRSVHSGLEREEYEFHTADGASGRGTSDKGGFSSMPSGVFNQGKRGGCLIPFMLLISSFGGIVAVLVAVLFVKGG